MTTNKQRNFVQQYGKFVCYLLFIVVGTFVSGNDDAAGQTVPHGTIIVRKVTQPNPDPSESSFAFTGGGGLSTTPFSLKNGETRTFTNVTPKSGYSISETPSLLWELSSASCSDGSSVTNIQLSAGETVTCTFTNRSTLVRLSLTKEADKASIRPGQPLVYTLEYVNNSLLAIDNVVLTEEVPAHTTFIGPTGPSGWSCSPNAPAGTTCTYAVGTVARGNRGTVDFLVKVDDAVPAGVNELTNEASIGTTSLSELAVATQKTTLDAAPDLTLSKSDGAGATAPGNTLVYQLTYTNQGNQAATGVVLNETLPTHTTFVQGTSTNGWNCTGTSCQFTVGTVAAGATATVNFAVKIVTPLPVGVTTIANTATIADDGANGSDPTPGNNAASATTTVNRTLALVATKRDELLVDADNDGVPSPGDTIAYTIQIRNNGNAGVRSLTFSDTPDTNSTLLTAVESSQGVVTEGNNNDDSRVEVDLGDLAGNGATATIRFSVRVQPALPLAVTAIQNQGVIRSDDLADVETDDPDTSEANDATRTPLRAFAQLQATLIDYLFVDSDGNDIVSLGDILIYRLTLDNTGNGAAGGIQIVDLPNLGLGLVIGSVSTSLGDVVQGNSSGNATMRVDIALLPAGERVLVSYQMRVVAGVEIVIQNQASIAVQTGLVGGAGQLVTDDPDIGGTADVTITPLGSILERLQLLFLPLVAK